MTNLDPTTGFVDVRYGPDANMRYDVLKHPIADPGGNPCLVWRHGGGWSGNDKRQPFIDNSAGNELFLHLFGRKSQPGDKHFTCISIETRQGGWASPLSTHPNNATIGWYDNPPCGRAHYPDSFDDYARAIVAIKANAKALGIDPTKIIAGGTSAGSVMAFYTAQNAPKPASAWPDYAAYTTRSGVALDSSVRGVVGFQFPVSFRRDGRCPTPASNWTDASKTITSTGAFTNYTFKTGDKWVATAGTGVVLATYTVASRVSNDAITLSTDINGGGGDISDNSVVGYIANTDAVAQSQIIALFDTPNAADVNGVPDQQRNEVSPQWYFEQRKVRVPTYAIYTTSSGTQPYASGHELEQFATIQAAAASAGLSGLISGETRATWSASSASSPEISERTYQAMCAMLQFEAGSLGG